MDWVSVDYISSGRASYCDFGADARTPSCPFQVPFTLPKYSEFEAALPSTGFNWRLKMKTAQTLALITIAAALSSASSFAQDHEKKITRAQLPAALEKTVSSQTAGATVKSFNEEQE